MPSSLFGVLLRSGYFELICISRLTLLVRALAFRFEAFGRPVKTALVKKFEEGIFSDLRNLKPGEDSSLEKPKVGIVFNTNL